MKKAISLFLLAAALASSLHSTEVAAPLPYVPGQVLVKMRSGAAATAARGFAALPTPPGAEYVKLEPRPGQTVEEAVAELESRSDVLFAQPNYIYRGLATIPNDTYYSSQYHLALIGAPAAWDFARGGASETIAILDSGVDTTLLDLAARIVRAPGIDIFDGDNDPSDTPSGSGHGTRVGGIAAAVTNNAYNVSGVDWNSNLLFVRVLSGADATGTSEQIDSGLRRAIQHRATVINLSLGFATSSIDNLLETRIKEAYDAGIILVAAAGNDGNYVVIYPASSPYVIAAGSSTSSDARSSFSNYGAGSGVTGIDVMAPGSGILTTNFSNGVISGSGTSYAAPIVSAAAALVRAARPGITPAQFLALLRSTAKDIGDAGYDEQTGAGRIDLEKLVRVACASSVYGDSLAAADTRSTVMTSGGRQNHTALVCSRQDSWAGFFQRHAANRGTIRFYWCPDSTQPSDTAFVLTQRGNKAHGSGALDLVYRSDGKLEYRLQDSAALVSSSTLVPGQWYHVALSYGESGAQLWVNGESETSKGVAGGPPIADTLFAGAPLYLDSAQTARGRFDALAFSSTQSALHPSALFAKVESNSTNRTEVGTLLAGWKAWSTDSSEILVDIYADTDRSNFNGVLLASNLVNDQSESVSLSPLTLNQSYYLYIVATDSSTRTNAFPERAYAYSSAYFVAGIPSVVAVGGSAGSSGGGCLLARWSLDAEFLRSLRDLALACAPARWLVELYYALS